MRCAAAGSRLIDTRAASYEILERLNAQDVNAPSLIILLATFHHRAVFDEAASFLKLKLNAKSIMGTTVESAYAYGPIEEGSPSLTAFVILGKGINVFSWNSTPENPIRISKPSLISSQIGSSASTKLILFFADPFTTPISRLIPALQSTSPKSLLVGGMASGASRPGANVLISNENVQNSGVVGVTLEGDFLVDTIVSQGVSPIGSPMSITSVKGNQIFSINGRPATDTLLQLIQKLDKSSIKSFSSLPLMGIASKSTKKHLGRGDFLIRNILGIRKNDKTIIIGDIPKAGDRIQFYFRDARTACDDFQMLLDGQSLSGVPAGVLLITCNGRSKKFFGKSAYDMEILKSRFDGLPIIGFSAAGEIGPMGNEVQLHGHAAVAIFFRSKY